jgi:serpin B
MKRLFPPILLAAGLPAADSHIVAPMNAFTVDSYKSLARNDGNLIFSPFNIATALWMVLRGARGQTAEEIRSVLHVEHDAASDASLRTLLTDLTHAGNTGTNELLAANGLWVQKGFAIEPAFEKTLASACLAPLTPVDFITDSEGARSRINQWTEAHTKEKIRNLFPAGSLDARTRLVVASAIYFYGQWEKPFITSRTQPAPFMRPSGGPTEASFMNQTSYFGYLETPSAQILEMPYAGTGIAFDVLLPKRAENFADLEKSLTEENLKAWLGKLSRRNVQVSLPKFRAESGFSLENELSAMGMPAAFSDKADFSGISSKGPLAISKVVHKAFVDVSEYGTEAAAATGISMFLSSFLESEKTVIFRADHPFVFLIRDTRSEAVLFIGRLLDPR